MALQLWLLRHGEAVPHGSMPDFDRVLTEKGEAQARAAGAALAALGVRFAAVYTSPRVRARDTARFACEALGNEPAEVDAAAGDFEREDALDLLHAHGDGDCVLIVGHEPDFSRIVHDLTGARVDFKKGGVAAVRLERGSGHLIALLRPRELSAIGQGDG